MTHSDETSIVEVREMTVLEYYIDENTRLKNRDPENRFAESRQWAITKTSGLCLNRAGYWEWEPMPSSRTDEFLERCRFSLNEAREILNRKTGELAPLTMDVELTDENLVHIANAINNSEGK